MRAPALDADGELRGGGDQLPRPEPGHGAGDGRRGDEFEDLLDVGLRRQRLRGPAQQAGRALDPHGLGLLGGAGEQIAALEADQVHVDPDRQLGLGVVAPRAPRVAPALDAVGPVALGGHAHVRLPDVEALGLDLLHVDAALRAAGGGQDHGRVDRVVALAEHVGLDQDPFVDDGLDGVGPALDHGGHAGHRDAAEAAVGADDALEGHGWELDTHVRQPSWRAPPAARFRTADREKRARPPPGGPAVRGCWWAPGPASRRRTLCHTISKP